MLLGRFLKNTHGGAAPALAESDVAQILREWKADKAQLLARYDRNGNGEIDMDEWEAARSDARREAKWTVADRRGRKGVRAPAGTRYAIEQMLRHDGQFREHAG